MRVSIPVEGLRITPRLAAIERAILEAPGITAADINLDDGLLIVDYDENATNDLELLKRVRLASTVAQAQRAPSSREAATD